MTTAGVSTEASIKIYRNGADVVAAGFGESTKPGKDGKRVKLLG